jgi:hypothetical protein
MNNTAAATVIWEVYRWTATTPDGVKCFFSYEQEARDAVARWNA